MFYNMLNYEIGYPSSEQIDTLLIIKFIMYVFFRRREGDNNIQVWFHNFEKKTKKTGGSSIY